MTEPASSSASAIRPLVDQFDDALGRVALYGNADQVRDLWAKLKAEVERLRSSVAAKEPEMKTCRHLKAFRNVVKESLNVYIVRQQDPPRGDYSGLRGVHATQDLAEAEIASICKEHPDLQRRDFVVHVDRVRGIESSGALSAPAPPPAFIAAKPNPKCKTCADTGMVAYWDGSALAGEMCADESHDVPSAAPAPPQPQTGELEVIVNGQPVCVRAGTVRDVIAQAIGLSGQIGAPIAQWQLRTTEGDIIPHELTDGTDYELTPGYRLWLNLGLPIEAAAPASSCAVCGNPVHLGSCPSPPGKREAVSLRAAPPTLEQLLKRLKSERKVWHNDRLCQLLADLEAALADVARLQTPHEEKEL